MPTLVTPRLASQLQHRITTMAYTDTAQYIPAPEYEQLDTPPSTTIQCVFVDGGQNGGRTETWKSIESFDAEIYFSALTPSKGARIKLLNHFGKTILLNKTYDIVGIQDRGAFGFVCALKIVTV